MDISAGRTLVEEMAETMVFFVVEHLDGREDQPPSGAKSGIGLHNMHNLAINRGLFSAIMSALASSSNGRVSGKPWKAQKTPTGYVVLSLLFLFTHRSV